MTALTPANQLTLLRMLLIPVFALLVIYGYMGPALSVFIIAGLTDALDGLLARRMGGQTTLGAWLDPVADKLLVATMFIVLALPLDHLDRAPAGLAARPRPQPRHRHRRHRLDREPGDRAAHVPPVDAGEGRDRDVPRHRRGVSLRECAWGAEPHLDGEAVRVRVAGLDGRVRAPLRDRTRPVSLLNTEDRAGLRRRRHAELLAEVGDRRRQALFQA